MIMETKQKYWCSQCEKFIPNSHTQWDGSCGFCGNMLKLQNEKSIFEWVEEWHKYGEYAVVGINGHLNEGMPRSIKNARGQCEPMETSLLFTSYDQKEKLKLALQIVESVFSELSLDYEEYTVIGTTKYYLERAINYESRMG